MNLKSERKESEYKMMKYFLSFIKDDLFMLVNERKKRVYKNSDGEVIFLNWFEFLKSYIHLNVYLKVNLAPFETNISQFNNMYPWTSEFDFVLYKIDEIIVQFIVEMKQIYEEERP